MLAIIGLSLLFSAVAGQLHPGPPPPPYNIYGGPINPYMQQMPQLMMAPMPPPPPQPMAPYPASTSVSYSTYPMMAPMQAASAAPYPAYGIPQPQPPPPSQPMMYPPPYQTFSGSGPMGDPFTTTTGICKYTGSRYQSPVAPIFNGQYKRANFGMICSRYS